MKIIDIGKHGKFKLETEIKRIAGGRFTRKERWAGDGVGIGGLWYDGGTDIDMPQHTLKCNIEKLHDGIVLYLRNQEVNYAIVFNYKDIERIVISKKPDVLKLAPKSYFSKLQRWGLPYHIARLGLLDTEIMEMHDPICTIHTSDQYLTLIVKKRNYGVVAQYFTSLLSIETSSHIEDYLLLK